MDKREIKKSKAKLKGRNQVKPFLLSLQRVLL